MHAVVMGGSGLVGRHLLQELSRARGVRVTAIARRRHDVPSGVQLRVIDAARGLDVPPCDAGFCALGTTIAKAGSQAAFRAVDHGLVLEFANACKAMGATQFHVVSAAGADPGSRVFYSRVKGEMERDVRSVGFDSAYACRPSILAGDRAERRRGERLGLALARVLGPVLPASVRAAPAKDVAQAMVRNALQPLPGWQVVTNAQITGKARAPAASANLVARS
ncbi:MAG TPA: NAD(P)H-binding protein [Candidatus Thermoplasmatota archaeon]|nr:NAD(P)H-binding protein [Candidatus Thermoplasmatota archaeon]